MKSCFVVYWFAAGLITASSAASFANAPNLPYQNQESNAFEYARDSWTAFVATDKEGDTELVWAQSLRVLALSKQDIADQYLAKLALFRVDGALSSELGCAMSKRGPRLAKLLKTARSRFGTSNYCRDLASSKGLEPERLCATEVEFARLARSFQKLPLKDESGACSY